MVCCRRRESRTVRSSQPNGLTTSGNNFQTKTRRDKESKTMSTTNSPITDNGSATAAVVSPLVGSAVYSEIFPSTEAQLEIWLSSKQGVEANCAYNEITSLQLDGDLNVEALQNALKLVVRRHDSLRTTFSEDGTQVRVSRKADYAYESVDWSNESNETVESNRLKLVQQQACLPFDLENGPLFRAVLQKISGSNHFLTLTAHHVVLDGWSLGVLVRDLGYLYNQEINENSEELPAAVSYKDYSAAMDRYFVSADAEADRQFWLKQFNESIPVLDLPIFGSRPALRTYFARRYDHILSQELVESLRKLGAKSGCSIFNTMLAAFESFVARIANSNDFCIGIPTAGQLAMESPDLIGHCVNTMPLRVSVDLSKTFKDQLKTTRGQMLDAYEHQRYTFGKILAEVSPPRDPSRPPMLAISFNVDPAIDCSRVGFEGLNVTPFVEPRLFENFEWFINGVIHEDKSIELQIQYNTDLFTAESMAALFQGFEGFLAQLVNNPDQRLAEVPVVSIAQRHQMLVDWNRTDRNFACKSSLHEEFVRQSKATPDKVAVKFKDRQLTYSELDAKSNQVANVLKNHGVGEGDLVGICFPRNEKMLVFLFGILKSGAGYVPLDPSFPQERLQYMCDHSQLKLVVGTEDVMELVNGFGKPSLILEQIQNQIDEATEAPFPTETQESATCYVIYTSGSTGTPKGVEIPHGAVVNFLHSMSQAPGFTQDDSVLAVTTLSFDIAVLELFLPLIVGGTTVIASKAITSDGQLIVDAINEHNITMFQSTPASLRMMISAGWQGNENLKVLCGGEPMPSDLVEPLLDRCSELWNMYGPTETTVWSSIYRVSNADAPILIGKPIANTQIYILDANLQPVPVGSDGEIYIGGAGVTMGYLDQAQMTRERFVENPYFNPFTDYCNHRIYRTGDLGRFRADGNIQFLRRNDKQVKVRGFRIELGEIETAIKSIDGVHQAVAIVREDKPGDTRLVAYWVAGQHQEICTSGVREALRASLPYYMVPQHFVEMDILPQTNNGKIDYKSLPAPVGSTDDQTEESLPHNGVQKFIASIWRDALNVDEVFINDNFFDLGGHSLLVMKVITAIEERTGARLTPPDFLIGTLEQLADKVSQQATKLEEQLGTDESNGASSRLSDDHAVHEVSMSESPEIKTADGRTGGIFEKIKGFWD